MSFSFFFFFLTVFLIFSFNILTPLLFQWLHNNNVWCGVWIIIFFFFHFHFAGEKISPNQTKLFRFFGLFICYLPFKKTPRKTFIDSIKKYISMQTMYQKIIKKKQKLSGKYSMSWKFEKWKSSVTISISLEFAKGMGKDKFL